MHQRPHRLPARPEAAALVLERAAALHAPPHSSRLRPSLSGLVGLCAGGAFLYFGHPLLASVAGGVGGATLLGTWLLPAAARARIGGWVEAASQGVGYLLSVILLAPVFFLFFWPFGLMSRRAMRARLRGARDPGVTAWSPRSGHPLPAATYERQW